MSSGGLVDPAWVVPDRGLNAFCESEMTGLRATSAGFRAYRPRLLAKTWPRGTSLRILGFDALWIFFIVSCTGAGFQFFGLGTLERYTWLLADLATLGGVLIWRDSFLRLVRRNAVLVAWPILACVSAIWSFSPFISVYHGLQLLMTILVAFLLCLYASFERIVQLIFVALLSTAVLSLLIVMLLPGGSWNLAGNWNGTFSHKNLLGHMMAILILAGICLLLQGWRPAFVAGSMLLATALLYGSKSGAATIALLVALSPLPIVLLVRRSAVLLVLAIGVGAIVAAAVLFAAETMRIDLLEEGLDALGKDATLTGRTLLWDFGIDAFNSRPFSGFGYKGYWNSTETSAYLLVFVIGQDLWYFHNNFIEVAVAFGIAGPILFIASLIVAIFVTLKRAITAPNHVALWPFLYVIYVIVLTFVENPLFDNHNLHQLLFTVCVAGSLQKGFGER